MFHNTEYLISWSFLAVLQELDWESVAIMNRQMYTKIPVVFEDVRFHRATIIPKEGKYCGAVGWSVMMSVMRVVCLMCVLPPNHIKRQLIPIQTIPIMTILILFFLLCPGLPVALSEWVSSYSSVGISVFIMLHMMHSGTTFVLTQFFVSGWIHQA